jgi:cytochrome bd-type quinol oxidase subunit 2
MARRFSMAMLLAALLLFAVISTASAKRDDQEKKSKEVPEVPIVAVLPIAAGVIAGGYYLVNRRRQMADGPVADGRGDTR